ncbi:LysE family translocator [Nitratireductor sp. StC3]|uniref:LysE family translocator n=1 Tax=Nitratireductor sp. StC3 TaxID=2126741 RepID=UPI000D0CBC0A|nr:LysE family translocator [Nitratireductor sp. StC3]PSM16484.1 lysine transporter LysE [Nitratireductor sp. StC3]
MIELTVALVVFLFPLAYSPGPGNMFFAAYGARYGVRATLPATTGYHVATWLVTVAIGFGFAVAIRHAPGLFLAIKWVGAAYVFSLAWTFLRAGLIAGVQEARPAGFLDGVILLALNPKAYLIIALMFTQFLSEAQGNRTMLVLWIATVFTLNNLAAFLVWTAVGERIAARLRRESSSRAINLIFATVLAAVAVWMMLR